MAEFKEIQIGENGQVYEVKDETARQNAGSGDGTVTGVKVGSTTYEPTEGVVDLSTPFAGKVDKNGTDSLMTAAEHTKLQNLPTATELGNTYATKTELGQKANDNAVVKSVSVNGTAQSKDENGNVNIQVQGAQVTVTTNNDGTFTIHSGENDYTINLNHTHENMAKLVVCEESGLPSTLDNSTIYAITDSGETEIEKLIIHGLEFVGGGVPDTGMPQVTKPSTLRPLNLGNNTGSGVTALVDVKARNLNYNGSTDGLTISVGQNSGLLLSYGQTVDANSVVVSQSDAMAGTQITVKYTGSGALDDGALVFSHDNAALASVVVVVVDPYAGIIFDKALFRGELTDIQGKCVTPTFDLGSGGHFLTVRFGYDTGSYGASGYTSEDSYVDTWTASKVIRSVKLGDTVTKIRVTLDSNNLANCFIYDETANVMLFKGPGVAFDDPYPGVSFGQRIKPSSGGSTISDNSWCLSPILELSATGHTVSVNFGKQQTGTSGTGMAGYTAEGSYVELFATSAAQRTIDLSSYPSIKKLMLPAYLSELENCYVHDDTSDEYLWKGLNVV